MPEKLQHDRVQIAAQDRPGWLQPYAEDRLDAKKRDDDGEPHAQIRDEQAQSEEQVEKRLVVQCPAERKDRRGEPEIGMRGE